MDQQKKRIPILFCTGHTGGHLFPAQSCAEAFLREKDEAEVHILLNRRPSYIDIEMAQKDARIRYHVIPFPAPPQVASFKFPLFLIEFIFVLWRTLLLFFQIKPQLVIGFGSFASVSGVLIARVLGIPILLHEQNVAAGRANRFLSHLADRVAISFPETIFKLPTHRVFLSGFPLRESLWEAVQSEPSREFEGCFGVLIFGGSQGALRLNEAVLESMGLLPAEERKFFAVTHIVGNNDVVRYQAQYRKLGIVSRVIQYTDQIGHYLKGSDLVISRSGAGTIFELAAFKRAAILIPYPHAYGHQKLNAAYLVSRRCARMIEEHDLTADSLLTVLHELSGNREERMRLGSNIHALWLADSTKRIVSQGWELRCRKN